MAAHPAVHPSEDALRALAVGKLNDSTAAALLSHLDDCPDCCKVVASLSGDDFLDRLRQAHDSNSTPAPPKSRVDVARSEQPSANPAPIPNLPPELAANSQYEILRELGRGGMGVVYLAKNRLMDRLEVLKVVNKTLLDHPGAVERFLREIRSAAKLNHANVVTAFSAVQQGELLAFAMEYVEGQDLASLVKAQGPIPVPFACYYVQQAALGLQHAHEEKMVHRDIKPQNLMLTHKGKKHIVKVLDFGLAKVMREKQDDTGLTGEGKMLGTPDYIAPEQTLDAAKADIRADIYSLGCTLYYLLSGRPPFSASSLGAMLMAHHSQEAKPLNLVRPEVPEELAAVVRKMMAKAPGKRYQTPLQVVQALAPFVKHGTTPKTTPELSSGVVEAKPVAKKAARVDPSAVAAVQQAKEKPEAANVWGTLTEESIASVSPRKSAVVRKPRAATVRERKESNKWLFSGGIAVGVLLLALLGMWAGGVFKVKTKDGILVVDVSEASPDVFVDGEKVIVSWEKGGKKAEIRVKPGTHKIEVKKDGFSAEGKELTFKDGDRELFTVRLLPEKPKNPDVKAEALSPEKILPPSEKKKPAAQEVSSTPDNDKGFVSLFNGRNFAGWIIDQGKADQWSVVGNTIVARSVGWRTRSYLLSTKEYSDFTLRFEFLLEPGGNGGLVVRAFEGERIPVNGEFSRWHPDIKLTDPAKYPQEPSGTSFWVKDAVKEGCKPTENPQLRAGKWHAMEITVRGETCVVTLDGKKVVDLRAEPQGAGSIIPALRRTRGKIGFLAHTGSIRFRNIQIKELPAAKSDSPAANPAPGGNRQGKKRELPWAMQFNSNDGPEYVAQLRSLGAILAFPIREDAGGTEYRIVRDLAARPPRLLKQDIEIIRKAHAVDWRDSDQGSVRGVLLALGIQLPKVPSHFIAFISQEAEQKLLRLELDHLNRAFPGRSEDDIVLTKFRLKKDGGKYEPEIVEQRLK